MWRPRAQWAPTKESSAARTKSSSELRKRMLLCLDIGNSQIFGGVYDGEDLQTTFRRTSSVRGSSDEFGTFFRAVFLENARSRSGSRWPRYVRWFRTCFIRYGIAFANISGSSHSSFSQASRLG